jgi:glutathione synthase/RimK-type ligase-like ATP-grasp enzyme
MKLYIHKDTLYFRPWHEIFKRLLDKKYKNIKYEIINLHYEDNINALQIGNEDDCICRFAHYVEDFELSKRVYSLLYEKFNGRIWPNETEWYYYNDKQRQLEFFKENNIPHPISHYSYGKDDFTKWVKENNLKYPIVVKKSQGASSEEVNLVYEKEYSWYDEYRDVTNTFIETDWSAIDFPVIAQQYIDVSHDIRITILGDKILFMKRIHHWKEDEKKRFPYGWQWADTDSKLDGVDLTYDEIEKIKHIGIYLKEITNKHLNSKVMSWDIIDEHNEFKVCEFSYCFETTFIDQQLYYDIKEEKILKMKNKLKDNAFYTQKELLKTIGA